MTTRDAAVRPLAERQARIVGSARAVADETELVCASLPSLAAYRAVALGDDGVRGGKAARIFVNMGTVGTRFVADMEKELAAANIVTIDCPISGGPSGAAAGTLSIMASGPKDAFAKLEPALTVLGKVTYVGEKPGMAQSLKLANNILSATALAATSEALVMGIKAGLDPETMLQAINIGSGRNSATLQKIPGACAHRRLRLRRGARHHDQGRGPRAFGRRGAWRADAGLPVGPPAHPHRQGDGRRRAGHHPDRRLGRQMGRHDNPENPLKKDRRDRSPLRRRRTVTLRPRAARTSPD